MPVPSPSPESDAFSNFESACENVLSALRERLGFQLVMVTRTDGDRWVVLKGHDTGYGLQDEDVLGWSDSFCSRMVKGEGPTVAPDAKGVPAYRDAPVGDVLDIGAYVGFSLTRPDGSLFGTLCAIDPEPRPDVLAEDRVLLEAIAGLFNSVLHAELRADEQRLRAERVEAEGRTDGLTGLLNRCAWDDLLKQEDARARHLGESFGVIAVDLDGFEKLNDQNGTAAGDGLLRMAGRLLPAGLGPHDVVARVGEHEFLLLVRVENEEQLEALEERVRVRLRGGGIASATGAMLRRPSQRLRDTTQGASLRMYRAKQRRLLDKAA